MLAKWLPHTEDKLPPNASHQVCKDTSLKLVPSALTIGGPCGRDADVSTCWTRVSLERMLLRATGRRRRLCAERAAGGARGPGAQRPAAGQGCVEDAHGAADPGRGRAGGRGARGPRGDRASSPSTSWDHACGLPFMPVFPRAFLRLDGG